MAKSVKCIEATEIEAAEAQYLAARVAVLGALPGNPFKVESQFHGKLQAFLAQSTSSPMMNRICGDCRTLPDALSALVAWFEARQCVPTVPLIIPAGKPALWEQIGAQRLRRLNGWTHMQFAAPLGDLQVRQSPLKVEELTADTVEAFAAIHAEAFHTSLERQAINSTSFSKLITDKYATGFLVRIDGKPAAGALVYFASNGVAYLGTAATRRDARRYGCHNALIASRIAAARKRGCQFIAATTVPSSQSRRNLERAGLVASHVQALYSPQPLQKS